MMVIAAFPSLGKAVISELNKFQKLTNSDQKYIEDVVKLSSGVGVPNKNKSGL